jgi:hypothetical protein
LGQGLAGADAMSKVLKGFAAVIPLVGLIEGGPKGYLKAVVNAAAITASFFIGGPLAAAVLSTTIFLNAAMKKGPSPVLPSALDRLNASLNPTTPRVMAFGPTALATDIRYVEPSGTNQEYIDYIITCAAHKLTSIDEIWFEDARGWTLSGGVEGAYSSYLTVTVYLEGSASSYATVNSGALWGASQRLTGCAYIHLRIKRSGNSSDDSSPFTSGLSSRLTIRGKGVAYYDPRLDSTVGGSGSHRADDQSTWTYSDATAGNIALQTLTYLLGWRINGKLSVGRGIPPARLDLAGWITAANLCDETVTTSTGTQPRYHGAGLISEGDDPGQALSTLAATCNGRMRETLGKLGLVIMHNDLASASTDPGLDDSHFVGAFTWNSDPSLEETPNIVRGRYTDPSDNSLYQLVDYPDVRIDSLDGIDRILTLDLPWCEDAAMAQRLAKQALERKQYQRQLQITANMAGWSYKVGDRAPVTPSTPIRYDPLNNPIILAINAAGKTADWPSVTNSEGTKPEDNATKNEPAGAWSIGNAYAKGDIVLYNGSSYTARIDVPVGTSLADLTYWQLLVQAGANGLSIAITPGALTVACASDGTPKSGTLPVTAQILFYDGPTDIHTSATYTISNTNCTATVSTSGLVTVTALSGAPAYAEVTATYGGLSMKQAISISQPRDGATGMPGTTTYKITRLDGLGTTAYGDNVALPPGSTVTLHAEQTATAVGGSLNLTLTAQYSLDGASFSNMGGSYTSTLSIGHSDTDTILVNGTYTNTTGAQQIISFQTSLSNSSGTPSFGGGYSQASV